MTYGSAHRSSTSSLNGKGEELDCGRTVKAMMRGEGRREMASAPEKERRELRGAGERGRREMASAPEKERRELTSAGGCAIGKGRSAIGEGGEAR